MRTGDILTNYIWQHLSTKYHAENTLSKQQEKIITIAAKGDLNKLKPELVDELKAGLTVNEIKEGSVGTSLCLLWISEKSERITNVGIRTISNNI